MIIKKAKDECIHRRSKFVNPTFYFELKFLLQMTTFVVWIIKRLKLLSMVYQIGWKAVYDHFEIDHQTQGETRKSVEDVYGEELDSDIEILNYKGPKTNRPYNYG